MADYAEWVDAGSPDCWCYPRQGCADFDHAKVGSPFTGYYRVSQADLDILIATWQVKESPQGPGVPGDCLPGTVTP